MFHCMRNLKNMNDFLVSAYAISNVGKRRKNNEDNFFLNNKSVNSAIDTFASIKNADIFVGSVCDGMGGEAGGEIASQLAVDTINAFEKKLGNEGFSDSSIEMVVRTANDRICEEIKKCKKRMGTTFTLLGVKNGNVTVSNIGDSRVYRYTNNTLVQVSHDHTEAQSMVDSGIISKEKSMLIKEKHKLTQHLGIFQEEMIIEPHTVRISARDNDRYLLCSDGLTDMLTESEIKTIFDKAESISNTAKELIALALEKGGKDNVTVMVCELFSTGSESVVVEKNVLNSSFKFDEKKTSKNDNAFWKIVSLILALLMLFFASLFVLQLKKNKKTVGLISQVSSTVKTEASKVNER